MGFVVVLMNQNTNTQPAKPVLTPATFSMAVLRLAVATDEELAEWDARLPAELRRYYHEQTTAC